MKKLFFISFLLIIATALRADMPGNKPRPETKVTITGVGNLPKGWVLYQESFITGTPNVVNKDAELTIRGGYGRPDGLNIWAENTSTGRKTPQLSYYNSDKPITVSITTVRNDSLIVGKAAAKSNKPPKRNNKTQKSGFLLLDIPAEGSGTNPMDVLIAVAAVAFVGLGWMYLRKRQAQNRG